MTGYREDGQGFHPFGTRQRPRSRIEWFGAGVSLAAALLMVALVLAEMHGIHSLAGLNTSGRAPLRLALVVWMAVGGAAMKLGLKRSAGEETPRHRTLLNAAIVIAIIATVVAIAANIFDFKGA